MPALQWLVAPQGESMKLRRRLVCLCALPLIVCTSGCDPGTMETVAVVIESEQVHQALLSVAEHTLAYILKKFSETIIPPAEAGTADGSKCAESAPPQVWILAAQGTASAATQKALEEMSSTPNEDLRRLEINLQCNPGEVKEDCERRARKLLQERLGELTEGLRQTSMASVQLDRATGFVSTWPSCREQVEHDTGVGDLSKVTEAVNDCMTEKGFGAEIAGIKLLFPHVG
jgi:hypothetical protein